MFKFCRSPWQTVHVGQNGNVWFCLCPNWHKKGPIGNLFKNSMGEICNSISAQEFKNTIIDQSFHFCDASQCSNLYNLESVTDFNFVPTLSKLPTTLAMAIDRNCNLKCPSCRNQNYYNAQVDPKVKFLLQKIVDEYQEFDQTVFIGADGSGDCFASAAWLEFFQTPNLPSCFRFTLATNGNLIVKNMDIIQNLYDNNQLHSVNVSLDAATADTYKKIRGGNFLIVLEGIKQMTKIGIQVDASFVLQQSNWHEVFEYYDLCKSLGMQNVAIQAIDKWGHMTSKWYNENQIINNSKINYTHLVEMLKNFKKVGTVDGGIEYIIQQSCGESKNPNFQN